MVIKKSNREHEVKEPGLNIFDYDLGSPDVGLTYQELNGRIPSKGAGTNKECKEWYFIISGNGRVVIDGRAEDFAAGDVIALETGSASYIEANKVTMLTITHPDWYPEQHELAGE